MKLDVADIAFSRYIRSRDGWRCVRCGTYYEPPTQALHCSHFFGRSKENTRYDPDNCDALCYGCHRAWGSDQREEYRNFKIKQLGKKKFQELELRSNTYYKKDRKLALLYSQALYNGLKKS